MAPCAGTPALARPAPHVDGGGRPLVILLRLPVSRHAGPAAGAAAAPTSERCAWRRRV